MENSSSKSVRAVESPSPEQKSPMNKRTPYYVLGGIVGTLLIGIAAYAVVTHGQENTDDAQIEADVVPLAVRTGGLVVKVVVHENQVVKAGDTIMELDPADQAARVKQAEAELATAKAQAAAADAQVSVVEATARGGLQSAKAFLTGSNVAVQSASAQISAARAGLERAKADLHKAELDLERTKALRAANAVSQERLDNAQVAFDSAAAQMQQATATLSGSQVAQTQAESRVMEAQGRLGQSTPIEAQIAAAHASADLAHASVQAAEARLDLQRLVYSYLKVVAPVDGLVSRLTGHEGQLLQTGQAVAELVPSYTYVVANFKETQVGKMKPGQEAEIDVDAYDGRTLHGKVDSLSGGTGARFSLLPPDNASGNFVKVVQRVPVRITLTDAPAELALRAGMSADVTVKTRD